MRTRKLGRFDVSVIGVGCNQFGGRLDPEGTADVVNAALDAGINFFDTADVYSQGRSEEYLGKALAGRRDDVIIATKFGMKMGEDPGHQGASAAWIVQACEDSLRRLGTDHIDLYQQHRPDADVPIDETLEALDRLVRAGKVLEIGCSNFSAEQLTDAAASSEAKDLARFVSVQNHYNLLSREPEQGVLDVCGQRDVAFLPYFPLQMGVLTGKYERGAPPPEGARLANMPENYRERMLNDETFDRVERYNAFAVERGHSLLDLAFAWLLSRPAVASVIAGATRPEQIVANVAAGQWELSADDVATVDAL